MIDLQTKNAILTLYKSGKSKSEIARLLGRNRRTVSKYIQEDEDLNRELMETEAGSVAQHEIMEKIAGKPEYKGKYKKRNRTAFTPEIEREIEIILEDEERGNKTYGTGHKLGRSAMDIHRILVEKGYSISYSTVRLRLKETRLLRRREAFIKQEYDLGERVEYDFGERVVTIAGQKKRVYVAILCSAATNYRDYYVYPTAKMEVFVDSQVRFFDKVGVYKNVVYDNMKNVVKKFVGKNQRELTDTVLSLSNYYGFKIVLTNPYSGHEKGSVEASVKTVTRDLFGGTDQFDSWEDLIEHVRKRKREMNKNIDIELERSCLPPRKTPYEAAIVSERRVSKYGFIREDSNDYSVPEEYIGAMVRVKRYPHLIEVFYQGELIASHWRLYGKNQSSVKTRHYLETMLRKPGALANSVALKQAPKLKELYGLHYTQNPREFLEILMDNKDIMDTDELYELLSVGRPLAPTASSRVEDESESQLDTVSTSNYSAPIEIDLRIEKNQEIKEK